MTAVRERTHAPTPTVLNAVRPPEGYSRVLAQEGAMDGEPVWHLRYEPAGGRLFAEGTITLPELSLGFFSAASEAVASASRSEALARSAFTSRCSPLNRGRLPLTRTDQLRFPGGKPWLAERRI